jgi:TonB family protein
MAVIAGLQIAAASPRNLGDDPATFDQQIDTATLEKDAAFIDAVVANDALFTHAGGMQWSKERWLNAVRSYNGQARNVDGVQVERHGDVVETTGHIQVKTSNADRPEYQVYYVRIYGRRNGVWLFLSHRTTREVDGPLPTTAAPATTPAPVRAGNGVTTPQVIKQVNAEYTSDARRAKIQGTVLVECVIQTDGTVGSAKIIRSLDPTFGLDQEALKAARQWRFTPATRNGEAVPVLVTIEVTFSLK